MAKDDKAEGEDGAEEEEGGCSKLPWIVAGVFALAAGGLGFMWFTAQGAGDESAAKITEMATEKTAMEKQIADAKKEAEEAVEKANAQLEGLKSTLDRLCTPLQSSSAAPKECLKRMAEVLQRLTEARDKEKLLSSRISKVLKKITELKDKIKKLKKGGAKMPAAGAAPAAGGAAAALGVTPIAQMTPMMQQPGMGAANMVMLPATKRNKTIAESERDVRLAREALDSCLYKLTSRYRRLCLGGGR